MGKKHVIAKSEEEMIKEGEAVEKAIAKDLEWNGSESYYNDRSE